MYQHVKIWANALCSHKSPGLISAETGFAALALVGSSFAWVLAVVGPDMSRRAVEETIDDLTDDIDYDTTSSWVQENRLVLASGLAIFYRVVLAGLVVGPFYRSKSTRYATLDSERQRTAVVHGCRAISFFIAAIYGGQAIWPIFFTGTADLQNAEVINPIALLAIAVVVVFIFELTYRSSVATATILHHTVAILGASLFLDGTSFVRNPSFFCYMGFQGFFLAMKHIQHIAMVVYHTSENRDRVKSFLAWAILDEIMCVSALQVTWTLFCALHFDLMELSMRVFILCVSVALVPAQLFEPYVLLLILKKEHDRTTTNEAVGSTGEMGNDDSDDEEECPKAASETAVTEEAGDVEGGMDER